MFRLYSYLARVPGSPEMVVLKLGYGRNCHERKSNYCNEYRLSYINGTLRQLRIEGERDHALRAEDKALRFLREYKKLMLVPGFKELFIFPHPHDHHAELIVDTWLHVKSGGEHDPMEYRRRIVAPDYTDDREQRHQPNGYVPPFKAYEKRIALEEKFAVLADRAPARTVWPDEQEASERDQRRLPNGYVPPKDARIVVSKVFTGGGTSWDVPLPDDGKRASERTAAENIALERRLTAANQAEAAKRVPAQVSYSPAQPAGRDWGWLKTLIVIGIICLILSALGLK